MIGFWIAALALTGAVSFFIIRPLWKKGRQTEDMADLTYDLSVYRDQLKEIDQDVAKGLVDEDQAEAARTEVKRRMLDADRKYNQSAPKQATTGITPIHKGAAYVCLAFLIIGGAIAYNVLGSPGMADQPLAARQQHQKDVADLQDLSMPQMADRLEAKMKENPDQLDGWLLLARTQSQIGAYQKAVEAMEQAVRLAPDSAAVYATLAEMQLAVHQGSFTPGIFANFEKALELDAMDPRALFYIGLKHFQDQDYEQSLKTWNILSRHSPAEAPWMGPLRQHLEIIAQNTDYTLAELLPDAAASQPAPAQSPNAMPGPSREEIEAAQEMTPEEQQEMIRAMVQSLADKLEENPNDPVGWQRLANAYRVLGETEKAEQALKRAQEVRGQ